MRRPSLATSTSHMPTVDEATTAAAANAACTPATVTNLSSPSLSVQGPLPVRAAGPPEEAEPELEWLDGAEPNRGDHDRGVINVRAAAQVSECLALRLRTPEAEEAWTAAAEIRSMESPLGVRPSSSSESAMQIQTTTTTQQTSYTHSHSIPRGLGMNTEISQSGFQRPPHHTTQVE